MELPPGTPYMIKPAAIREKNPIKSYTVAHSEREKKEESC